MIRRAALLLAAAVALPGCGGLVPEPPAEPPERAGPPVLPDAPAARGIAHVEVPALSRDGYRRRAERLTVRVRNLSCEGVSTGSGFAVDASTLITNRHVVAGADLLEVNTSDGRTLEVSAAEVAVLGDIALVHVVGSLPVTADLGGRAPPGSEVAAVGFPLGGPVAITRGVVIDQIDGRPFGIDGPVVRITAEVQPGNSGGPLLDGRGRVAGVVFAVETATGLGLAIPTETVLSVLRRGGTTAVPPCDG